MVDTVQVCSNLYRFCVTYCYASLVGVFDRFDFIGEWLCAAPILAQLPPYQLAKLHTDLKQKGALPNAEVLPNYFEVIRKLA